MVDPTSLDAAKKLAGEYGTEIIVTGKFLHEITEEAIDAISQANAAGESPVVYQRGNVLTSPQGGCWNVSSDQ